MISSQMRNRLEFHERLRTVAWGEFELIRFIGKMDGYDECFADDESDNIACSGTSNVSNAHSFNHEISNQRHSRENRAIYTDSTEENECVFDVEWALKRRYSLSSLIYSRFLVRLEDRMKTARCYNLSCLGR